MIQVSLSRALPTVTSIFSSAEPTFQMKLCPPHRFAFLFQRMSKPNPMIPPAALPHNCQPIDFQRYTTQAEGQCGALRIAIHKVFAPVWHRQVRTSSARLWSPRLGFMCRCGLLNTLPRAQEPLLAKLSFFSVPHPSESFHCKYFLTFTPFSLFRNP